MRKISIELLHLVLPGLPPTANKMYRTGRNSARYKRPEVSAWQEDTANLMREAWGHEEPYTGNVKVYIEFRVKNRRRWDIDNRLKALLDCFALAGVIEDDRQICGLEAYKIYGQKDKTTIRMSEYTLSE